MKKFSIPCIYLVVAITMSIVSVPGYAVTDKVTLKIEGMTWAVWPLIIRKALEGLDGVKKASVSYSKGKGEVYFDPAKVSEKEIVDRVNQTGFRAKVIEE